MTEHPYITVLMPVYNGIAYLEQAIESVLNQSLKDFEFLIVDDCSTDCSLKLIRKYQDPRIRLIVNEENMGQAASLNRGLAMATGRYVARLDQDDVCLPERFRVETEFLERRPDLAIVCTWEYSIDEKGRRIRRWTSAVDGFGEFVGMLLLGLCPVWHPSVMFRRDVVQELGGYDPSFAPAEDYELWSRIGRARWAGAIVPEFLTLQRIHGNRQSVTHREVQEQNTRRAHENLIRIFCDSEHVEVLGALLRMEDSFWQKSGSPGGLRRVLDVLSVALERVEEKFHLSAVESAVLRRVLYRRLGPGVRLGTRAAALPPLLLYPLFVAMSPMLIPQFRRPASFINHRLPELRYPGRVLQSAAERIIGVH